MFDGHRPLWVIHIGNDDQIALRARNEGFICIGWTKMGDLSRFPTREATKQAMRESWPNWKEGTINASYGQVYRFAREMQIGDPVVFPTRQTREIAIGRIESDYRFAADEPSLVASDYSNVRRVTWLRIVPRTAFSKAALHSFGSFSSVSTSNDHLEEVIAIVKGETFAGNNAGVTTSVVADPDENAELGLDLYDTAVQETEDFLLKSWISSGTAFEHVVAAVLEAIGYTVTVTSASGDHGVDIIAHPDPLGFQKPFIKVQVKSGTTTIGEPEVSQLVGSLLEDQKGIVISLGGFTAQAKAKARNSSKLTLIDAKKFVSLFLEHYEQLEPAWQAKFPLSRVYVPRS